MAALRSFFAFVSIQVSKPLSEKVSCCHCGEPCPDFRINQNDPGKSFCCDGCDTVYNTIQQLGLGEFYRIDEAAGLKVNKSSQDWSWMDADIIGEKLIRFSNGEVALVHWSLPSIHCRSCLWLLEKLPEILPGVHSVRVRMDRREADIRFYPEELALSQLASQLDGLGYAPKISRADLDSDKEESTDLRRLLSSKIGVAGFCAGNVMLLALPEYLGWSAADSAGLEWPVRIAQLLLTLPILFYSASDLFKSAWISLRRGVPSVDIPVVLGILALAARSGVALATGEGAGYLDSLAR
jgi:Cu+-exporting ATPase